MIKAVLAALALICAVPFALAQDFNAGELQKHAIERRAVEAAIWGMPAVNTDLMRQEMLTKTPGKVNQFIYWGRPLDDRNQTLTPNPDTLYFMGFFDTKEGPMVLEVPPGDKNGSLNGNIVTQWQTSLEDVGLLGVDKGAGGKFVILPPGYDQKVPEGYSPLQSDTYGGYALVRPNLKSHADADVAASIDYAKRVKFYPLSAAANPPETVFSDVRDIEFDSTIRYDPSFYEHLDRVVQSEPWIERDRAMIDQLRTIGIEKGKPFAPDEATKAIFATAISEAKALLEHRYDAGFPPFWDGSRWTMPALPEAIEAQGTTYADRNKYAIDARGLGYTYAYISIKRLGAGQFYLISIRDKDGDPYDGGKSYRLTVPPDPPVDQYWSVTVYDRQTHALVRNMERASRASNAAELQKNADGSVDIFFGPKAPAGKETNWVPTDPQRGFELMFRLYAPTQALFDKTWRLPDVEKAAAE
ncbi:DUF1254 domain-containing protein [Mesorhizobium sp. IMUNJ 23232]|uniref:DUF1254 domain-containing protein n=1 Tax=Mesorhizobium sp. IMUNJ 23232 TaxID=3376064 RepID=UPI0037998EEA